LAEQQSHDEERQAAEREAAGKAAEQKRLAALQAARAEAEKRLTNTK
jgi:hypothetical protein